MAVITHEKPDQRRHFRSTRPMSVRINYFDYPVKDWSLSGLSVKDLDTTRFGVGEQLLVEVIIPGLESTSPIGTPVEIVWVDHERRRLAARFIGLASEEKVTLAKYFTEPAHNGKSHALKPSENKLTPVSEKPTPREAPQVNRSRLAARRLFYSFIYLFFGFVLLVLVTASLYFHFFRLDLDYCVVSKPLTPITSQDTGQCLEILVTEGEEVRAGQTLVRIDVTTLTRELESAELKEESAKADLKFAEERVKKEEERLARSKKIADDRLASAKALVESLEKQLKALRAQLVRETELSRRNVTTLESLNYLQARVAALDGDLLQARAQERIAEHAVEAIKHGDFYDGRQLVNSLRQYKLAAEEAAHQLRVATNRVKLARSRAERTTYEAPFDGRVIRVMKSVGAPVSRGEILVVLEQADQDLVIDGFATQAEVGDLQVGGRATAYVPAIDRTYEARVIKIDRTSGFLTDVQAKLRDSHLRYNYRGEDDKSAFIQLQIVEPLSEGERAELAGGLPVSVSVSRQPSFWRRVRPVADEFNSARNANTP